MEADLQTKYDALEEKYNILCVQHDALTHTYNDTRRQYARLSAQMMRLQSENSQQVARQTQDFIRSQQTNLAQTLSATRLRELVPSIDANPCYTMITPYMAIGEIDSDYTSFDIVINMCFLGDTADFKHHDLTTTTTAGTQLTRIAIYDNPLEKDYMKMVLHSIIPVLVHHLRRNPSLKILFHCYAGISRSGSFGIAFMAHLFGMTYDEALIRVKEKRGQVDPNPGFVEAIKEYLEEIRQIENMVVV